MEIFGNTRERVDPVADRLWPVLQDRDRFVSEAKNQGVSADLAPGLWACLVFNLADARGVRGGALTAPRPSPRLWHPTRPAFRGLSAGTRSTRCCGEQWAQGEAAIEAYQAANPDDTEAIKVLLKVL